ncbi:hypothetical protein C8N46_105289 [Kordia periserrulae]|uniref:Uncharacterized protein n=1 Tax=Kordia periserrulae TaxID=701523 RepID=A0A2T6BYJ5_9FLAO|nr:hypothetical protein [Kordia periserrulae]PTX61132.1 hypothetical protein C8N46_105289 [Kordia periserrulae]
MKKKQILSKLQLQKTTIVSFKAMKTIMGKSLVNVDTIPISVDGVTCVTLTDCRTQDGQYTCMSCTGDECTRPTTRTGDSHDCGANDTKENCLDTRRC